MSSEPHQQTNKDQANKTNSTLITESASNLLLRQLKSCISLTKHYEQQSVSARHIEETEKFAESLLESLKNFPHQTLAQLALHRPGASYFHNFQFNACIYCALVLLRNKMNLSTAQQILCGTFTWIVTARESIEPQPDKNQISVETETPDNLAQERIRNQLTKALTQYRRTTWLHILNSGSAKRLSNIEKWLQQRDVCNPIHDYLKHSLFMALSITRHKVRKPVSFASALKSLVQLSHSFAQPLIEPLLSFPGEILPGNVVKIANGRLFLMLGEYQQDCYTLAYSATEKKYLPEIKVLSKAQISSVLPATPVANLRVIEQWWGRPWKELLLNLELNTEHLLVLPGYRMDKPPESLTNVIQHLNDQDLDIGKLTQMIEAEPGFAEHIRLTASHKSRAKMKISDVKHGLLMNGIERTKSVLVEKALVSRLNQNYFPLQTALYQFVKLWASFAESIAQRHPRMLPEQCSCWVHFAASGLFTNAEIKSQLHWYLSDQDSDDSNEYCISINNSEALWQHALKIAQCWAQEQELTGALKDALTKKNLPARVKRTEPHALLCLSLLLATRIFLDHSARNDSEEYLLQFLQTLGLKPETVSKIQAEAMENSHTYWPIHSHLVAKIS